MSNANWQPTDNQRAALTHCRANDYRVQVRAMCREIGISHQAYYQWFDTPEFCEWWAAAAERHFARLLPHVYAQLWQNAQAPAASRGDTAAAKVLLDRFDRGFAPATRQDIEHHATLDLSKMSDEELRRHAEAAGMEHESACETPS